jgi:hypothetical protein
VMILRSVSPKISGWRAQITARMTMARAYADKPPPFS